MNELCMQKPWKLIAPMSHQSSIASNALIKRLIPPLKSRLMLLRPTIRLPIHAQAQLSSRGGALVHGQAFATGNISRYGIDVEQLVDAHETLTLPT